MDWLYKDATQIHFIFYSTSPRTTNVNISYEMCEIELPFLSISKGNKIDFYLFEKYTHARTLCTTALKDDKLDKSSW